MEQKQNKRASSLSGCGERPSKRPGPRANIDDDVLGVEKIYKFRVLLPNGMSLGLKIRDPKMEMPLDEFVDLVKQEYFRVLRQTESQKPKRRINWKSPELHFVDALDNLISKTIFFKKFRRNKYTILSLHDGSGEAETYENMWDLTPDTDLLMELPAEYTFETALADLIDNSLQAVWSNGANERRLVSVEINDDKISIFDTGSGMDGSDENSIVKWGKMGASLHRSSRGHGIGGKPPYLMPCFGMFGYGGPIASMHLGRHALVSSKTKQSKKVYTLHLEREALLSSSGSEKTWKTDGGIRHPMEDETRRSPQCSFTKVEIFEPKMKGLDVVNLQCKLKDIYFPYIQCDEVSCTGKTIMPIEFQVNGTDLAEIQSGEVAITNLHSCNGPEFVLQLHFSWDAMATSSPGVKASPEANARLKFIYLPIVEGKESIEKILEKLEADGCGITENFGTFSRVSVWRLGRLLPDARWTLLPFMDRRQKKGDRAQILKRCCLRVKCFIDTDAGFNPTPSKTDLAHHHPCTTALKNFGDKPLEKGKDATLRIYKDGKQLTLLQVEKLYQEWIFQMHDRYDEEIDSGVDQPLIVVSPSNKKRLGISSDVVRVHKVIQRKGSSWKSGQKIKVLKGACAGCHKNNMYATLEYILLEGFQGDSGGDLFNRSLDGTLFATKKRAASSSCRGSHGEARLICRPLGLPSENGCVLAEQNGNVSINICGSVSLPISVIDSGKCLAIETVEWEYHVEKQRQKTPSTIEILSARHCPELMIEEEFPIDSTVYAGHVPPKEIVAVVRPASFNSASASKNLDQKYIVKENFEMCIQIKFRADDNIVQDVEHIYSGCTSPSSHGGFHGLYIFPLGCKLPDIFQKAGVYTFSLSLKGGNFRSHDRELKVKALSKVGSWGLLSDGQSPPYNVRVGLCFPPLSVGCYDIYGNRIPFASVPKVRIEIISDGWVLAVISRMELNISLDKLTLEIKDTLIEMNNLDKIQPDYEATLIISSQDELFSVSVPCRVLPGSLQHISIQPKNLDQHLLPGHTIEELILEMFDAFGNHVEEGLVVMLNVDGFSILDHVGSLRKVDERGCIDLSGLLKVEGGYGKNVSLSVLLGKKILLKKVFETEKRELRAGSEIPKFCMAGSLLENVVFEIVNSEGDVDVTIHDEESRGQFHMLTIKSESFDTDDSLRYSFRYGRCIVRAIFLPQKEGIVHMVASHLRHPELSLIIEVHVLQSPKVDPEGFQPQCTNGKVFLLQDPSSLKVPKVDHDDVHDPYSDGNVLLLQDSSTPDDIEDLLAVSILKDHKELEEDVLRYGLSVGNHEEALNMLNVRLTELKENVSTLQASLELNLFDHSDNMPGKEVMIKLIESKVDSAAAVVCRLFREIPFQGQENNSIENILGVVALLGTVENNELSRILAEYLGEDQMLAVVGKSYAAARTLEKYEQNRSADYSHALHAVAQLGQCINGRYLLICLEDIRPYTGELGSDPERKLSLPDPILPSGNAPSGYLGYAANMINIDALYLHTRTDAGHGLRETLFYRLFGELQVYETRQSMEMAKSCIKHDAVSLDGGIMRGNGIISLGHSVFREQGILFPIAAPGNQSHLSPHNMELLKQIEENKLELKEIFTEIEKETKTHRKILKKFRKKKQRYNNFLDKKGHLLKSLEYRLHTHSSNARHC